MKKILLYGGMLTMLIMFVFCFVTIHFRDTREVELQTGLAEALDGTMSALCVKETYEAEDSGQLAADLLQGMLDVLGSDSEVEVNILDADLEKGLLRVEVVQSYRHVNGRTGTVSCERTVLFDRTEEEEQEVYHVYLYLTRADLEKEDGTYQDCYKQYKIMEGKVLSPKDLDSPDFHGWKLADGTLVDFTEPVGQDIYAYAFD